jgi:hypothetical protein
MWVGTSAKVWGTFMLGGVAPSLCKTVLVWQLVQVGPYTKKMVCS